MAATHRSENRAKANRVKVKASRVKARHRAAQQRRNHTYTWLGAGALTLGFGAALASGAGIAHASTEAAGKTPTVSTTSTTASGSVSKPSSSAPKHGVGGGHLTGTPASAAVSSGAGSGLSAALKHSASTSSTTGASRRELTVQKILSAAPATGSVTTTTSTAAALKVTPATKPTPTALVRAAVSTPATKTVALAVPAAAPTINGVPVAVVVGALATVALAVIFVPAIALGPIGIVFDLTVVGGGVAIGEGVAQTSLNAALSFIPGSNIVLTALGQAVTSGVLPLGANEAALALGGLTGVLGTIRSFADTVESGIASLLGGGSKGSTGTGSGPGGVGSLVPCMGATCTTNPANGQVSGTVSFANGANTYSVTSGPTNGTVVVNPATGAFTYIPTEAAELTSTALSTDSFTETATKTGAPPSSEEITVPISGAKLAVTNTINLSPGAFPLGVVVTPDGSAVYVADDTSNLGTGQGEVSVINTAKNTLTTTIPIPLDSDGAGTGPVGVAAITNVTNGTVSILLTNKDGSDDFISTATNEITSTGSGGNGAAASNSTGTAVVIADSSSSSPISVGPASVVPGVAVAVSPNGNTVYYTVDGQFNAHGQEQPGSVEVFNTASNTLAAPIQVGIRPGGVAVSPTGTVAYVTNEFGNDGPNADSGTVSAINTATNNVTTINAGAAPDAVAFSPDGSLAYVTETEDGTGAAGNTVEVFNTATNKLITTVTVGTDPEGVAVAPNGSAYVTNVGGNGDGTSGSVSVISLVQNG